MSEWIYRNAIVAGLEILRDAHKEDDTYSKACQACIDVVKCAPTYDAVEVVRCKDCRYGHATETLGETCWHCGLTRHVTTANGYCDKGVKRHEAD